MLRSSQAAGATWSKMSQPIKEVKALYRKRLREAVGRLDKQSIEQQSATITEKAIRLPEYQGAEAISVFLSMPGKEVSTKEIVLQAFRDGKKVFVPYIHTEKGNPRSKVMDMLQLQNETDLQSLKSDAWGIPSLSADSIEERQNALGGFGIFDNSSNAVKSAPSLDLVFVPATGFDQSHNRLGHGKGFYDRYLSMYQTLSEIDRPTRKVPFLVGLALNEQVLGPGDELPTNSDDWKVDVVIDARHTP